MNRNPHATLTASMVILGATIIFSQGWWTGIRNFIADKTESGAKGAATVPQGQKPLDWRWVWGFVILWIALSFLIESQEFAEIGAALAVLIAMSAAFAYGPTALANLGIVNAKGK